MQKHQTVSLWTHECPGLPNIPISLHEAVWLLSPFPFQNTFFARAPAEPLAVWNDKPSENATRISCIRKSGL